MNHPLVTIITVTYNSERFIAQAIESVLYQSYQNFEYIISDDCSTDKTLKIISQFSDSRIIKLESANTLGQYSNRNKAVGLAKGKYIFFIDGDDVALNRGIELAVTEMELHPNCGFGIAKRENPKFIGPIEIKNKDAFNLEYFGENFLNSSLTNNVYKTEVLKKNLLNPYFANADTYLRLEILKNNNVLILINPIALWRISNNQESKKIDYNNQLLQHIHFIKNSLLEDTKFNLIDKKKLKTNYYKLIYQFIKLEILQFRFSNLRRIKQYFIDSFFQSLLFSFQKKDKSYWSQYSYENLNIEIKR